jgi:hypothetical protein
MTTKQASSRPPSTGHRHIDKHPNPRRPAHPIRPKRRSRNRRRDHGQRLRDDHYVGGRGEHHQDESTSKKNAFDKNDDEYERLFLVEKIVDCKMDKNGMPTYKTRWMGYSASEDTWEPYENVGSTGHV